MQNRLNQAIYNTKKSPIRVYSQLAAETKGCIALTLGEPNFDTPAPITQAAVDSLHSGDTHYIANAGSMDLRKEIAAYEKREHGMTYAPEEIIVTVGATEALFIALMGILNPGDEVIIPLPAFLLYGEIVNLARGRAVYLDTSQDRFQIRADKLNELITDRTKAIILNSPNNPTGSFLNNDSLEAVRKAVSGRGIFVICDDVYRSLVYRSDYRSFSEYQDLKEQILLVQSFSKPYAMTGWRMGYLAGDAAVMERLTLLHQYNIVSTPAPFQKACIQALHTSTDEMFVKYRRRRDYMLRRLRGMDLEVPEPLGAFYQFPSIKEYGMTSGEFCTRMIKEAGLAATPGGCFGCGDHIRFSYCCSDRNLMEGMDRLQGFLNKLKGEKA